MLNINSSKQAHNAGKTITTERVPPSMQEIHTVNQCNRMAQQKNGNSRVAHAKMCES